MIVHLIDGTYELFRQFYGLRRFNRGNDRPFGAVSGVLHTVLQMIEMGRPLLDHLQHGMQHAAYRAKGPVVAPVEAAQTVELAEQLVRAIDEMNDHGSSKASRLASAIQPPSTGSAGLLRQCSARAAHLF